jgi:hypothetical protein
MLKEFKKKQVVGKAVRDGKGGPVGSQKNFASISSPSLMAPNFRSNNPGAPRQTPLATSTPSTARQTPLATSTPKQATISKTTVAPTSTGGVAQKISATTSLPRTGLVNSAPLPARLLKTSLKPLSKISTSPKGRDTAIDIKKTPTGSVKDYLIKRKTDQVKRQTTPLGMYPRQIEAISKQAKAKAAL